MFQSEYIQANAASFLDNDWVNITSLRDYLDTKAKSTQTAPASSLFSRASSSLLPPQPAFTPIKREDVDTKTLSALSIIKSEPKDASSVPELQANSVIKTQTVSSQGIDYIEILSLDEGERYVLVNSILCSA